MLLANNCWFEQTWRKENGSGKTRYEPTGLIFRKRHVYALGGRPVIYDVTEDAKGYLPTHQWWRIVNFDLRNENNIVDWPHEREWRIPHKLSFNSADVVLLFANNTEVNEFIKLCDERGTQYYRLVRGITTMESIVC